MLVTGPNDNAAVHGNSGEGWRRRIFGHWTATGFLSLTLFSVYLGPLLARYGFADDYSLLAGNHGLGADPWGLYVSGGRPLGGVMSKIAFSLVGDIDELRWLRLVGIIGIVMLAILMHRALLWQGLSDRSSVLIAIFVCVLPPFQVYASWATLFVAPYAALLAGTASLITFRSTDSYGKRRARLWMAAVMLLSTATLIHQSAAMFFWVFAAIPILFGGEPRRRLIRASAFHLGIATLAAVIAYAAFRIGIWSHGGLSAERSSLTNDVVAKGDWFLRFPSHKHSISPTSPHR